MSAVDVSTVASTGRGQMDSINIRSDEWTWKRTTRADGDTRNDTFPVITFATVLSVLLSMLSVMQHWGAELTATFILIGISGTLLEDLTSIPGHFLAYNVRRMFAVLFIMWVVPIWYDNEDYLMIMMIITASIVPMGLIVNKRMLYTETWKYSINVQHGLNMAPNSDAETAWSRWGCAECTSLYGFSGNDPKREVVEKYAKPVFFLAYTKMQDRFYRDVSGMKEMKARLNESEEQIRRLRAELAAAEQNLYELKTSDDETEFDMEIFLNMKKDRDHMAYLCSELEQANAALFEELTKKDHAKSEPDDRYLFMTADERVVELLGRGKSYREIEAITGVSKSKVGKIAKTLEETEDGK